VVRPASPSGLAVSLPSPRRLRALNRRLLDWYAVNARDLPWRRTTDPYAILVSEVMLQQTQVSRVVPRFEEWLRRFPTLETLASAPLADVLTAWSGLGYNNRARRLRDTAAACVAAAAGGPATLPDAPDGLLALPGVGPYTARAVLIFARNADLAAVDANVRRVLTHELGLPPGLPPGRLQLVADAALPRGRSRDWHNALMDYGSAVLTSRATAIAPRTRQAPFEGSRRALRAAALRILLSSGPLALERLATELDAPPTAVEEAVVTLAADGLVRRRGDEVLIA
jgi:A/G-specific adenine glycosylase